MSNNYLAETLETFAKAMRDALAVDSPDIGIRPTDDTDDTDDKKEAHMDSVLTPIYDDIKQAVPRPELLALLAEECSELSQAALKLRRVMLGENPTPVSEAKAWQHINEEVADVLLSIALAGTWIDHMGVREDIAAIYVRKLTRFWQRLYTAGKLPAQEGEP